MSIKYLPTGNAVYSLTYHLVLVTNYRRKVLTKEMLEDIKGLVENILFKNKCRLIESNGEEDHIHMVIELSPVVVLTKIINSIKTVSSRVLRKKYKLESLKRNDTVLWSPSYFIATCGDVGLDKLIRYVENQGNKFTPPKTSLEGA
jgi:putative transposase